MPGREHAGAAQLRAIAAVRPIRAVCLGDSVSAGLANNGSWFTHFVCRSDGRLLNWYYPTDSTKVLATESYAVSGSTVDGFLVDSRRDDSVRSGADVAFVNLGLNSLSATGVSMSGADKTKMRQGYLDICESLALSGKVVVAVPLSASTGKEAGEIVDFNGWLAEESRSAGFLLGPDVYSAVSENVGQLTVDGVHLSGAGVNLVGGLVADWFKRVVPNRPPVFMPTSPVAGQVGVLETWTGKTAGWGNAGYGTPAGTLTAVAQAATTDTPYGSWLVTKTGGENIYCMGQANIATGFAAGDWVMRCLRLKSSCLAGGSYLASDFSSVGGHGSAYWAIHGAFDFPEWSTVLSVYKVPAGTTALKSQVFMKSFGGSGTTSTGTFEMGGGGLVNLSALGVAEAWGLA